MSKNTFPPPPDLAKVEETVTPKLMRKLPSVQFFFYKVCTKMRLSEIEWWLRLRHCLRDVINNRRETRRRRGILYNRSVTTALCGNTDLSVNCLNCDEYMKLSTNGHKYDIVRILIVMEGTHTIPL